MLEIPVKKAEVLRRINRFVVEVKINGRAEYAWLNNTGRLLELIYPRNVAYVQERKASGKTRYRIIGFRDQLGGIAITDTKLQEKLFLLSLKAEKLPEFKKYVNIKRYPKMAGSTFDFLLSDKGGDKLLLELKSAVLRLRCPQGYCASYPDTYSERGRRHLETILKLLDVGFKAGVVFFCGFQDATAFMPNTAIMPELKPLLEEIMGKGGIVIAIKPKFLFNGRAIHFNSLETIAINF